MLACPGDSCLAYCGVNECIQVSIINNGKCHINSLHVQSNVTICLIMVFSLLELILGSLWNITQSL